MIALDAMGGDYAPRVAVQGAAGAARRGIRVGLFGDERLIIPLLDEVASDWRALPLEVVHCTQQISMDEEPTRGVVKKQDASLVRAVQSVAEGRAQAVVSAGNSGAALVAGALILERVHGVIRPALGNFLPALRGSLLCVDLGANVDCKPEYLEQFACMGHIYVQMMLGINEPRIALLSNGAEPYKGSAVVKQAYTLLERNTHLNFVGNVEARDIFDGRADVLVCDGFAGNIMLKTAQGTFKAVMQWLKEEAAHSWINTIKLLVASSMLRTIKKKTDYASAGGALLLGVNKPLIVAHGCSSAQALEQAVVFAHTMVREHFVESFNKKLTSMLMTKNMVHEYTPPQQSV